MAEPTREELQRLFIEADKAGNEEDARFFLSMLDRAEPQQPQRAPRGIQEQAAYGIGQSLMNTGRGFADYSAAGVDLPMRALDSIVDWNWLDAARDKVGDFRGAVRQEGRQANEQFQATATPIARGAKLTADIGQFAVPAAAPAKVAKVAPAVSGMGSRILGQMVGASGTDYLMQRGEGAEDIDVGRNALTALFAGGGEAAAPLLGRAYQIIRGKISGNNPVEVGRALARELGIDAAQMSNDDLVRLARSGEEAQAIIQRGRQMGEAVDPDRVRAAQIAENEFGFRLDRGQKTGNFQDASMADYLRQTNQGRNLRNLDDFNTQRQQELVEQMTGGLDSPQTVVDNARRSVRGARDSAQQAERAAWQQLDDSQLRLSASVADDFAARTRDALSKFPTRESKVAQDAYDALKQVDDILRQGDSIDMRALQDARSTLSARAANAATPREATMLNKAKKAFDDALSAVDDGARVSGDLGDIEKLRNAVGTTANKYRTFSARGKGDDTGRAVENILQTENVDKLTSRLMGSSQVTGLSTGDFARALTRTLGKEAPELKQLRQAVLLKAATRSGDDVGPQQLSRNIKRLLKERRDVLDQLFTPKEISQLGRMTQALDVLWQKPQKIGRSSGTTERALRFLESQGSEGLPGLKQLGQLAAWVGRRRSAKGLTAPVRSVPSAPAVPAAAAASSSNRSNRP